MAQHLFYTVSGSSECKSFIFKRKTVFIHHIACKCFVQFPCIWSYHYFKADSQLQPLLRQIVNYSLFRSLLSWDNVNITIVFFKPRRRCDSHLTPILQARHWTWGCRKAVEWKMPGSIYAQNMFWTRKNPPKTCTRHIYRYMFFTLNLGYWIAVTMENYLVPFRFNTHNVDSGDQMKWTKKQT